MNTRVNSKPKDKIQSVANDVSPQQGSSKSAFQLVDNRAATTAQRELNGHIQNNHRTEQASQLKAMMDNHSGQQALPIQQKPAPKPIQRENNTGLSDNLKSGIENLSGYAMDDVKVHYNSAKPAQLQAHAYAQGTDIHLASGQEKHLPHEAWHVVQQKQGRVKPTLQMKTGVNVNDDAGLENEADVMGAKALQTKMDDSKDVVFSDLETKAEPQEVASSEGSQQVGDNIQLSAAPGVVQMAGTKPNQPSVDGRYRIKLSSAREKFSYDNRAALGLDDALPQHYRLVGYWNRGEKVIAVRMENGTRVDLKEPIPTPGGGKHLLMIDTVGHEELPPLEDGEEREGPEKLFIDIKIGEYTKSGQQYRIEGAGFWARRFKRLEHNLKDLKRKNRWSGYDIDKGNKAAFDTAYGQVGDTVDSNLKRAMWQVALPLSELNANMALAPVTFVGASVFIVLNLTRPQNSSVKLIDPDHPILLQAPGDLAGLGVPADVMSEGKMDEGRDWELYREKWNNGFDNGFENFIGWFQGKYEGLPGETPEL